MESAAINSMTIKLLRMEDIPDQLKRMIASNVNPEGSEEQNKLNWVACCYRKCLFWLWTGRIWTAFTFTSERSFGGIW